MVRQIGHRVGVRYQFPESRTRGGGQDLNKGIVIQIGAVGEADDAAAFDHAAKLGHQFAFFAHIGQGSNALHSGKTIVAKRQWLVHIALFKVAINALGLGGLQ